MSEKPGKGPKENIGKSVEVLLNTTEKKRLIAWKQQKWCNTCTTLHI